MSAHMPTAHYVTKTISKTAAGFSAVGALTLPRRHQGCADRLPVHAGRGRRQAHRNRKLNRLDFGVGQGDWKRPSGSAMR